MDEMKMEREMQTMLHQCAEGLEAPDTLKTRIDFALKNSVKPSKVRRPFTKRLAAVALVAAVAVTGAVAGSGVTGWYSNTWLDQNWKDFSQTAEYVQEHVPGAKYVESFSNGYTFDKGYENTVDKRDDSGNTLGSFTEVMLNYEKNGAEVTLGAEPVQEEGQYTSPYDTVRTVGETEVHYRAMKDITLPPDGSIQPTEEEQAAFERGEINIAYGSSAREEHTFYRVSWIENGISYSIYTMDPCGLTEDDFFQMAQEIIES